ESQADHGSRRASAATDPHEGSDLSAARPRCRIVRSKKVVAPNLIRVSRDRRNFARRSMAQPRSPASVTHGDAMPRITLPTTGGSLFDSWDPATSGLARVYWLGEPLETPIAVRLGEQLASCETLLHIVAVAPPETARPAMSWVLDHAGELAHAF